MLHLLFQLIPIIFDKDAELESMGEVLEFWTSAGLLSPSLCSVSLVPSVLLLDHPPFKIYR